MRRHIAYLSYVLRHKFYVFQECLKLGVPLWIAIFHDWDKFLPDEWIPYARTFYNSDGSKKQNEETIEFALAWKQHQHRNKHHWQYWCNVDNLPLNCTMVMIWDRGQAQGFVGVWGDERNQSTRLELHDVPDERINCSPIPELYMREMLADWRGAGRAITGKDNTPKWYAANRNKMKLHPDTKAWIDQQLHWYPNSD